MIYPEEVIEYYAKCYQSLRIVAQSPMGCLVIDMPETFEQYIWRHYGQHSTS